jgi:putative ATP-binding cassette transporter
MAVPDGIDEAAASGGLRAFFRLNAPFLRGKAGLRPIWLMLGVVAMTIAIVVIQIRFNLWNRDFFNALEVRDRGAFLYQCGVFLVLATLQMVGAVGQLYLKQMIQLDWRAWLTEHLIGKWLAGGTHYQMTFMTDEASNPDQRIADDVRYATENAVDFALGLLIAVLMLISFVGILWTVSGPLNISIGSAELVIPGYMVWGALIYALVGSLLTYLFGRPLVEINVRRNSNEGDFRFGLVRLRESSEAVALIRGEADEQRSLRGSFSLVRGVWLEMMRAQRRLMTLTSAYGSLLVVLPTLVASPSYFAGAITLGGLTQIVAAFGQVQASLNWFVDNFPRIAEWRSNVDRVLVLNDAIDAVETTLADPEQSTINYEEGDVEQLVFSDLSIATADGAVVIDDATARIRKGERVLITGESGTGKSTLFRAIAGLWPWGSGRVIAPPREATMFMPQRPYLPLGTLRGALAYPGDAKRFTDDALVQALKRVGLDQLAGELDQDERWDQRLSLGQQQRLAFARLLLQRPAWVFMDEATAALDEENQDTMMRLFQNELAGTGLVSIGHRPGLDAYHDRTLSLVRAPEGARLVVKRRPRPERSGRGVGSRLRRLVRRSH